MSSIYHDYLNLIPCHRVTGLSHYPKSLAEAFILLKACPTSKLARLPCLPAYRVYPTPPDLPVTTTES